MMKQNNLRKIVELHTGKLLGKIIAVFFISLSALSSAVASDGLVSKESKYSVVETANRFEKLLKEKGLTLFSKIDHAKNAKAVNLKIRPTLVIVFGNPKIGSKLMQCQQQIAIDLPLKALFWKDESGKVWLSYNDPEYLKQRHSLKECDPVFNKMKKVLKALSVNATT